MSKDTIFKVYAGVHAEIESARVEARLAPLRAAYGASRTPADIRAEIYGIAPYSAGLKHGPNQSGESGPCDPDCRKCALEAELAAIEGALRHVDAEPRFKRGAWATIAHDQAAVSTITLNEPDRAIVDQVAIGAMSAAYGERRCPPTEGQRRVWARELRRRVQDSETRERNRVLVDRDFEDWE